MDGPKCTFPSVERLREDWMCADAEVEAQALHFAITQLSDGEVFMRGHQLKLNIVVELKPLSHKRDRLEKLAKAKRKGYQKRSKWSSIAIAICWPECREMPLKLPRKRVRFRKKSTVVERLRIFRLNSHAFLLSTEAPVGKSYISCGHIVSPWWQ